MMSHMVKSAQGQLSALAIQGTNCKVDLSGPGPFQCYRHMGCWESQLGTRSHEDAVSLSLQHLKV